MNKYERYRESISVEGSKLPDEPKTKLYGDDAIGVARLIKVLGNLQNGISDDDKKLIKLMIEKSYDSYEYDKLSITEIKVLVTQICLYNSQSSF